MITFAITGGIATGKSTVTNTIISKYKIPIVDADIIAREVVAVGQPCLKHLVNAFNEKILNQDGSLNRSYLGQLCFNDPKSLLTVNRIVGSKIKEESFKQIQKLHSDGYYLVGYDSAMLIEFGLHTLYYPIIVVTCSEQNQLTRLMKRNNFSKEEALARINVQMKLSDKINYANFIIHNDNGLMELNSEIYSIINKLKQL